MKKIGKSKLNEIKYRLEIIWMSMIEQKNIYNGIKKIQVSKI